MKPILTRSTSSLTQVIRLLTRSIVLFAALFSLERAHAVLYLTDGFDYPAGELTEWSGANTNMMVVTTNMTYPGLADTTPSGSGSLLIIPATSSHNQNTNFISASPYVTNGNVYCSFLLNATVVPTTSEYLVSLVANGNNASGSADPLALYTGPASSNGFYKLSIRTTGQGESSDNTNQLAPNTTNFIVVEYSFTTSSNTGTASLWVNPAIGGSQPAPNNTAVQSAGSDPANLAVVSFKCQATTEQGNWNVDAIRVGSTWADVTPTPNQCIAVTSGGITAPVSQSVYAGLTTSFAVAATGTSPTYQWQLSTNSGSTWNNIANATNDSYMTPATTLANNGSQYRCSVSVACDSSQAYSSAATLTVTPAPIFGGVIVSNTWQSDNFSNPPPPLYSDTGVPEAAGDIESCWFALGSSSSPGISNPGPGSMEFTVPTNSRTWFTYFTSNGVVNLTNGELIKVTTVFQPQGVVNNTNANLSFGLFNSYAPGASRVTGNLSSSSAGANYYQGYDFIVNFSTIFQTNNPNPTPIQLQVRTNLADSDMMGNSGDYTPLGSGGSTQGATGFTDNDIFTNIFTVAHGSNGVVTITSQFTGPAGFNVSYSTNDFLNTNDIAFDTFGIRPVNNATTATNIIVTLVEVQTGIATNQTVLTPIPLDISHSGTNVVLTWANPAFSLYASPSVTNPFSLISGATSGYTVPATNGMRYFRLLAP